MKNNGVFSCFLPSLIVRDKVFGAGTYLVVVDVIWNDQAWAGDDEYRDLQVTLLCNEDLNFTQISKEDGQNAMLAADWRKDKEWHYSKFFRYCDDEDFAMDKDTFLGMYTAMYNGVL